MKVSKVRLALEGKLLLNVLQLFGLSVVGAGAFLVSVWSYFALTQKLTFKGGDFLIGALTLVLLILLSAGALVLVETVNYLEHRGKSFGEAIMQRKSTS